MEEKKLSERLEKRKYFREHPEEARKEYVKRNDGFVPIGVPPKKKEDK